MVETGLLSFKNVMIHQPIIMNSLTVGLGQNRGVGTVIEYEGLKTGRLIS